MSWYEVNAGTDYHNGFRYSKPLQVDRHISGRLIIVERDSYINESD